VARDRRTAAVRRAPGRLLGAALALSSALALAATQAPAATAPRPRCADASIRLVLPQTQGTATQAVAFLSVRNRAAACRLVATASLSVTRDGARIGAVSGNPVTYRINETIGHGMTMLFDAWWANWCATRSGSFRARGVLGRKSGWAGYRYLPVCLSASHPSSLRGVRSENAAG
jgi:hypothetical protein